jgi:hypothetical protein
MINLARFVFTTRGGDPAAARNVAIAGGLQEEYSRWEENCPSIRSKLRTSVQRIEYPERHAIGIGRASSLSPLFDAAILFMPDGGWPLDSNANGPTNLTTGFLSAAW